MKIDELNSLLVKVLSSKYYSKEEAEKIAEVFIYAELSGKNTQGIMKLFGTEPAQHVRPEYSAKIIKQTKISALIDGGRAAGPLSAQFSTDKAIDIVKENGFAIVGMNNTVTSVGAIGYYARKIAKENFIGIVMANCSRSVAPIGGLEKMLGTNPIAFGFPTNEHPIVFDMATSAITWYGLVRAKALGQKIPDNVAIDREGNITTDPSDVIAGGAILPFDHSYKGFGLGMAVELLTGVLSGASFVFDRGDESDDWGTTFIAFSPDLLIGTELFKQRSSELVKKVKSKKTKDGSTVHLPGYDTEFKIKKMLDDNEIEIEDTVLTLLREIL